MSNNPKQLLKKDGAEEYSDIHPFNYIQNITDSDNNVTLEEYIKYPNVIRVGNASNRTNARRTLPEKLRRAKIILMYYAGEEICEQFIGTNDEAQDHSTWINNSYWKDINIDTIVPDEEDLTNTDGKVHFKNNEYNPNEFSGYGCIIIRKYISNGKNLIYQDAINQSNTRYIIKYDFDLDGNSIELPNNCILDFQGGSIKNGTIKLNKAKIFGWNIREDYLDVKHDSDYALGQILYLDNSYKYWNGSAWISFLTQNESFVTVEGEEIIINTFNKNNRVENEILYLEDSDIIAFITNQILVLNNK